MLRKDERSVRREALVWNIEDNVSERFGSPAKSSAHLDLLIELDELLGAVEDCRDDD